MRRDVGSAKDPRSARSWRLAVTVATCHPADVTVPIAADEVAVCYRLTEALDAAALGAMAAILSAEERARRDRFVFDRDRRDFVAPPAPAPRNLSPDPATSPQEPRVDTHTNRKPPGVGAPRPEPPPPLHPCHPPPH